MRQPYSYQRLIQIEVINVKTEYQIKILKETEAIRFEKIRKHKLDKESKKAMTKKLKPIKRRIRDNEKMIVDLQKRIMSTHQRVREDKLLLLKTGVV